MIVTVNTDASFYISHKVAGFAFWIVCDMGRIMKGGQLKGEIQNPIEAELKAIGNALHVLKFSKFGPIDRVIVNTDCKPAIMMLSTPRPLRCDIFEAEKNKVLSIVSHFRAIEFRHVKAHNNTPDARSFVNEWCDKEAKKWALIALKRKKRSLQSRGGY